MTSTLAGMTSPAVTSHPAVATFPALAPYSIGVSIKSMLTSTVVRFCILFVIVVFDVVANVIVYLCFGQKLQCNLSLQC